MHTLYMHTNSLEGAHPQIFLFHLEPFKKCHLNLIASEMRLKNNQIGENGIDVILKAGKDWAGLGVGSQDTLT